MVILPDEYLIQAVETMKPIRGEKKRRIAEDPWNDGTQELGQQETLHVLSDEGAIESYTLEKEPVAFCGCISPPIAWCAVCLSKGMKGTMCSTCRRSCSLCHKQICPRHTIFRELPEGESLNLCEECHAVVGRKRVSKNLTRMVLSSFIRFEDENG